MELQGIPPDSMIEKSRKKEHYFDFDFSPFLIEDNEKGILRIPSSREINFAIPSSDMLYLDFVQKCLEIDPENRFGATEALNHPWIKSYRSKRSGKRQSMQQHRVETKKEEDLSDDGRRS